MRQHRTMLLVVVLLLTLSGVSRAEELSVPFDASKQVVLSPGAPALHIESGKTGKPATLEAADIQLASEGNLRVLLPDQAIISLGAVPRKAKLTFDDNNFVPSAKLQQGHVYIVAYGFAQFAAVQVVKVDGEKVTIRYAVESAGEGVDESALAKPEPPPSKGKTSGKKRPAESDAEQPLAWGARRVGEFGIVRGKFLSGFDLDSGKAGISGSKLGKWDLRLLTDGRVQAHEIAEAEGTLSTDVSLEELSFETRLPLKEHTLYVVRTSDGQLAKVLFRREWYGSGGRDGYSLQYVLAVEPEEEVEMPELASLSWLDDRRAEVGSMYGGIKPGFDFERGKADKVGDQLGKIDIRLETDHSITARKIARVDVPYDDLEDLTEVEWKQNIKLEQGAVYAVLTSEGRLVKFAPTTVMLWVGGIPGMEFNYALADNGESGWDSIARGGLFGLGPEWLVLLGSALATFTLYYIARTNRKAV